jgi:phosphatidylserine decarboxylase
MFAKGSLVWLASPLAAALAVMSASIWFASMVGYVASVMLFLITILLACFFRDPERVIGNGAVSPADGKVAFIDEEGRRLSIVMGLRHVHVTRAPQNGTVAALERRSGRHLPAVRDVSEKNERAEVAISGELGDLRMTLITGFIARRILLYVRMEDELRKGDRVGIIRFGSRVDLQLPEGYRITVRLGSKVRAGESQIAEVIDDTV